MSRAHLDLIKHHEGLRLTAYRDPVGVWTIGWGHTRGAREGLTITRREAERLLKADVAWAEAAVDALVRVPIHANQRAALISWTYNLGRGALERSTLLQRLNAGEHAAVPDEMRRWVWGRVGGAKERLPGLIRRREDEAALWLKPVHARETLTRSRTIWASIVGGAALITEAIARLWHALTDATGEALGTAAQIDLAAGHARAMGLGGRALDLLDRAQPLIILIVLGVVVYARWNDHRHGRR